MGQKLQDGEKSALHGSRKVEILVRIHAIVIAKNPKGQVAETSRLARRSLGVRAA